MQTIPSALQTLLNTQYGIEPLLLIEMDFGDGTKQYSTKEWSTIYGAVQEFSDYQSAANSDSVATTSKVSVTFNDSTGYFKHIYDTVNMYSIPVTVYLSAYGSSTHLLLFEGKIEDPISYNLDDKKLSFDIVSTLIDKDLGYVPTIEDIDVSDPNYNIFKYCLNNQMWPEIFGTLENVPLVPLLKNAYMTVQDDVNAPGPYSISLKGDLIRGYTTGTDYTFNIIGYDKEPYNMLITGQFSEITDNVGTFTAVDNDITKYWYTDVAATKVYSADETTNMQLTVPSDVNLSNMYVQLDLDPPEGNWVTYLTGVNCKVIQQRGTKVTLNIPNGRVYGAVNKINWASKCVNDINTLNKGAKFYPVNMTLQNTYLVACDEVTSITPKLITESDFKEITNYTLYYTNGNDANALWNTPHPACSYVVINESADDFFIKTIDQNNLTFVADIVGKVSTDASSINDLLLRYTDFPALLTDVVPNSINFAILEEDNIVNILQEIAWQNRKVLRTVIEDGEQKLELLNFVSSDKVNFSFTPQNIHSSNTSLIVKNLDSLKTKVIATVQDQNYNKEPITLTKENNISLYGELKYEVDYYTFSTLANAETVLQWWVEYLSVPHKVLRFTGYMDAFVLELWDRVTINLGNITFKDPGTVVHSNTLPLHESLNNTYTGRIVNITARPLEGLIDFEVQIDETP